MAPNSILSYFSPSPKSANKIKSANQVTGNTVKRSDLADIGAKLFQDSTENSSNIHLGHFVTLINSNDTDRHQIYVITSEEVDLVNDKENIDWSSLVKIQSISDGSFLMVERSSLIDINGEILEFIKIQDLDQFKFYQEICRLPLHEILSQLKSNTKPEDDAIIKKKRRRTLVIEEEKSMLDSSFQGNSSLENFGESTLENASFTTPSRNKQQTTDSLRKSFNFEEFNFLSPNPSCDKSESTDDLKKCSNKKEKTSHGDEPPIYPHHSFDFLQPNKVRDSQKRLPSHPDYDPTTLFVPYSFITSKEVTPAMKQWWKIKSENFDAVIFFKMGKFYELFHMDADVAVKELALIYMRGNYAHAGFPEVSFPQYAGALISRGYRVVRVEQTETPEMLSDRLKAGGSDSSRKTDVGSGDAGKVVNREVCSVVSAGTRIYDEFDIESGFSSSSPNSGSGLLVCISQSESINKNENVNSTSLRFGITCLDATLGHIILTEFDDDSSLSHLRTFVIEQIIPIVELVFYKNQLSEKVVKVLKSILPFARIQQPSSQKMTQPEDVLKLLSSRNYFSSDSSSLGSNYDQWPEVLKKCVSQDNFDQSQLMFQSFGLMINILHRSLIDHRIISMKNITWYCPPNLIGKSHSSNLEISSEHSSVSNSRSKQNQMILDESAITNLDILRNSDDSLQTVSSGSLLSLLNHCKTEFGCRLLPTVLCRPLLHKKDIEERLDAVDELKSFGDSRLHYFHTRLADLPDLEKLLFKVHSLGTLLINEPDHPENRAVIFSQNRLDRIRVDQLLFTLDGFKSACDFIKECVCSKNEKFKSPFLIRLFEQSPQDEVSKLIDEFASGFDYSVAKNDAIITPKAGFLPEFDEAIKNIDELQSWFEDFLESIKLKLRVNGKISDSIKFMQSGKSRYLLEVSDQISQEKIESVLSSDDSVTFVSQRKGFHRFNIVSVQIKLKDLVSAEQKRDKALKNSLGLLLIKIASHFRKFSSIVERLAYFDVILSFVHFSMNFAHGPLSRPIISGDQESKIVLRQCYHPCVASSLKNNNSFVPNDVSLGTALFHEGEAADDARTLIITGPNMGGKSTLMRQVAFCVIMAQLGCYVPAKYCEITPFDRVFARLGAAFDRPQQGQSTFYVELLEAGYMLKSATTRSLVVLDELGRGTSSDDGQAIASAVLDHLIHHNKCLTLFSTHYHSLVSHLYKVSLNSTNSSFVKFGHMACDVDQEEEEDELLKDDPMKQVITFLYELREGICPKSYGFHAAKLAGIPNEIIHQAIQRSIDITSIEFLNCVLRCLSLRRVSDLREILHNFPQI